MKIENISIKQKVKGFFDSTIRSTRIEEAGFSLLIVLLFVGFIGFAFSSVLWYQQGEAMRKKSYAAGWHIVQLSKAARVYVRDRSTPTSPDYDVPFSTGSLNVAPIEVTVADLIAAGLLPVGFPSVNPLGQNIRIFAANYPPRTVTPNQVPTAYLVTDVATAGTSAIAYATSRNMAALMQGAREAGMAASAPLISGGVNLSDDCDGTPAVMIWDTGCLNATDIDFITSSNVAIAEGQVIVPSWRVINQDFRALMRYPQPENIGANTMLTDLHMGHPTDPLNPIHSDTLDVENRFDIVSVGSMDVVDLQVQDQNGAGDDEIMFPRPEDTPNLGGSGDGAVASTQHVLVVRGNLDVGASLELSNMANILQRAVYMTGDATGSTLTVEGDMRANRMSSTGLILSRQSADPADLNVVAVDGISAATIENFDQINTQDLVSDNVEVSAVGGIPGSVVVQSIENASVLEVEGDGSGPDTDLRVFTQITMNGAGPRLIDIDDNGSQVGGAKIRAGTLEDNSVDAPFAFIGNGGQILGGAYFTNGLHVNRCDGNCPDELSNNPPPPEP